MSNRLGEGRDLSGGQIAGQDGKRAPRDGLAAQPGHQPAPPGRPCQHRRRQPSPRPRPAADAKAAPSHMNDFAVSLEVPRAFRTVHPLGWAIWKGDFLAPTEEELLTGIQGRSREDGDRDVTSDRPRG